MSGTDPLRAQALALAALAQAAALVDDLARNGSANAAEAEALLAGLFRFEWSDPEEVFGGPAALRRGLGLLCDLLGPGGATGAGAVGGYMFALLRLGRALARDGTRLAAIRARLEHASRLGTGARLEELASALAATYQEHVSTLGQRIEVRGSAMHLQDPRTAERIRALLLAGLRAAVLWRHLGGTRLGLLWRRARLLDACRALHRLSSPA